MTLKAVAVHSAAALRLFRCRWRIAVRSNIGLAKSMTSKAPAVHCQAREP